MLNIKLYKYIRDPLLIKVVGLLLLYICKQISSLTWFLAEGLEKVFHKIIETTLEETLQTTKFNLLASQQQQKFFKSWSQPPWLCMSDTG